MWTQPAIAVVGMDVTSVAESSNTIIPSVTGVLSLRVAPGQNTREAAEKLVEHLKAHAPFGAKITAEIKEAGPGYKENVDSPAAQAALDAFRDAWHTEPVNIGSGGSIPFVSNLKAMFPHAEVLLTGIEDPDTRAHSQNESLALDDWKKATTAEAILLSKIAEMGKKHA